MTVDAPRNPSGSARRIATTARWQIWIDRGGTFIDCVARAPSGAMHTAKTLSSESAVLELVRQIMGVSPGSPIPPCELRLGTTIATNALLERRGCSCALIITRGFGDLLEIGDQSRPELFALDVQAPTMLYREVLEIGARVAADGTVLERPDDRALLAALMALRTRVHSLAVVVLHSYRAAELEQHIGELAHRAGFAQVSLSHRCAAEIGLLARAETTVVDAYLTPLLHDYLERLSADLGEGALLSMQSSGGLAAPTRLRGPAAVLSGPAAGVVACAHIAEQAGIEEAIGFDMGGTSTDVSRICGQPERRYETTIAGVHLRAPMLAIHTVAAGGGSICRFDGQRLRVGPESAGADPGPLCYGRAAAQALTLTDINLALGRLQPDRLPLPLDRARVDEALARVARDAGLPSGRHAAAGFFEIACQHMAGATGRVSVARGHDVRRHTLILFGGAAGQHGCAVARRLAIRHLLIHPHAGVLSAYGLGLAPISWHGQRDAGRPLLGEASWRTLGPGLAEIEERGRLALACHDGGGYSTHIEAWIDLRYRGSEAVLPTSLADVAAMRRQFEQHHRRLFGYARADHPIEIVSLRVALQLRRPPPVEVAPPAAAAMPSPVRHTDLFVGGHTLRAPIYLREALGPGHRLAGPAVLLEQTGTIVLEPGFELRIDERGWARLSNCDAADPIEASPERDPVQLELFLNHFTSIAEQMGAVLRRTALSTNIRERLDYSCALFDGGGGLVANAPHIPVHLGAMERSVQALLESGNPLEPGSAIATNDPAAGGSHLPDITVVSPLHDAAGRLRYLVASRGHHADVGGITPGSMPPAAQRLEQEGIVLHALPVVRDGQLDETALLQALQAGPYPARNPRQNIADISAQLAANQIGTRLLGELVEHHGHTTVAAYMHHVQCSASEKVAAAIARLPDGPRRFADAMDDGTAVVVTLSVAGARLTIDFDGTGPQHERNLNAPPAITTAAVIYVLRLLVGEDMPLCGGCLRAVELRIPPACLLAPEAGRAVAGGNVETSQRIVDVLLGALGLSAASQGTMNNLSFGTDRYGYYETLGGGCGATCTAAGASAVHSHMTNTRITDVEVLEARFPVRVLAFSIRRGSGGAGAQRGGDGLVRHLQALEPMTASVLSQRRCCAPFGLAGGLPGAPGHNRLAGRSVGPCSSAALAAGDEVIIATPGGGGYGPPPPDTGDRSQSPPR